MKNYEAFCAFVGGIGCLLFAVFIAVTFFTSAPEARISTYNMVDFTLGMTTMGIFGIYLAWKHSKMYRAALVFMGSISCLMGSLFIVAHYFTTPLEARISVFQAFDFSSGLVMLGFLGLYLTWDYLHS